MSSNLIAILASYDIVSFKQLFEILKVKGMRSVREEIVKEVCFWVMNIDPVLASHNGFVTKGNTDSLSLDINGTCQSVRIDFMSMRTPVVMFNDNNYLTIIPKYTKDEPNKSYIDGAWLDDYCLDIFNRIRCKLFGKDYIDEVYTDYNKLKPSIREAPDCKEIQLVLPMTRTSAGVIPLVCKDLCTKRRKNILVLTKNLDNYYSWIGYTNFHVTTDLENVVRLPWVQDRDSKTIVYVTSKVTNKVISMDPEITVIVDFDGEINHNFRKVINVKKYLLIHDPSLVTNESQPCISLNCNTHKIKIIEQRVFAKEIEKVSRYINMNCEYLGEIISLRETYTRLDLNNSLIICDNITLPFNKALKELLHEFTIVTEQGDLKKRDTKTILLAKEVPKNHPNIDSVAILGNVTEESVLSIISKCVETHKGSILTVLLPSVNQTTTGSRLSAEFFGVFPNIEFESLTKVGLEKVLDINEPITWRKDIEEILKSS